MWKGSQVEKCGCCPDRSYSFLSSFTAFMKFLSFVSSLLVLLPFPSPPHFLTHTVCFTDWLPAHQAADKHFPWICHSHLASVCFLFFFLQRGDWQQGQALAFPHLGIEALTGRDSSRGCALNTERQPHFLTERQKESVFCVKHVKEVNFSFVLCRITAFSSCSVQLKPSYCIGFTQCSVQTSSCASHLL